MNRGPARSSVNVLLLAWAVIVSPLFPEDDPADPVAPPAKKAEAKSPVEQKIETSLLLRKAHKYGEALAALREAAALNPTPSNSAEIVFRTGETYFRKAQEAADGKLESLEPGPLFHEAIKTFEDLARRFPGEDITPEGVYLTGSSYLVLGELEKALASYRRAFDGYPSYKGRGRALLRDGVCQAGLDDPASARVSFSRYLREFPAEKFPASKLEIAKVQKYLRELSMVGLPAPPLRVPEWLLGLVGPGGLKTFDGEVVVLVFFATWCENCSAEMPHLRSLMNAWAPRGVVFLGIGDPEDPKNTQPVDVYVKKNEIQFLDVGLDRGSRCATDYLVAGLPAAAILDRKGVVRWRGHLAFFPRPLLEKALDEK